MKKTLLFVTMMAVNAFAVERKQLMPLIEEASVRRESAYLEVRNKIVAYGADAIPVLGIVAVDETLPWQQQLVARICYERIERKGDIERVITFDWYNHPDFDPKWNLLITGPEIDMGEMVIVDLKRDGLWYYYLEAE